MSHSLVELRDFYREKLLNDCLPFWLEHAVDRQFGGFITCLDRDGSILDTDKNVWQQGRFTWLLAELFNDVEFAEAPDRELWLETAKHGAKFLEAFCFDPTDGRMWFQLDQSGRPIRKRRYSFSESFAAMAFGELHQATAEPHFAHLAEKCFTQFLEFNRNPPEESQKFTLHRQMQSLGSLMISIVTAQELRDSIGLSNSDEIISTAIAKIERDFVKPELQCVMETVGPNGEILDHFDGRTLNPGHAIEAGWFIIEEGRRRNLPRYQELGRQMLDWMWLRGKDPEVGGLLYYVDVYGKPVQEYWHDMKFWWPHNEALIALLLSYEVTGEDRYLQLHQELHQWCYQHFQDDQHREWFGYLHRDGTRSVSLKGNHWKGPFHYPRMLLTCIRIIDRITARA